MSDRRISRPGRLTLVLQERFGLPQWTAHDLRRTVVSRMAELGVTPIVLAHIINHVSVTRAGVTLGVYQTYTYDAEKRAALQLWADRLSAIIGGDVAKVLRFTGVKQ